MSFQDVIQDHRNDLSETDWLILSRLEMAEPSQLSIEGLARECHVSTTSIFRFCQKLGLSGFSELKVLLKTKTTKTIENGSQIQQLYHTIVKDIERFDSHELGLRLKAANCFYIYARSEVEIRLAKALQRIFFPLGKPMFILPNEEALVNSLGQLKQEVLCILVIDSQASLPLALQNSFWLQEVYTFLVSDLTYLPILFNDRLLVPNLAGSYDQQPSLTPYILALEMLYLKILLENDTNLQK
ncbi:MurR/RpiR family transcriptional regulator [Streptococcus caprae]|uniref:MurR/RpiR family transcriptional regulator n=1 Tax=Streptococcus caprae TaxID=1640501 RepID=A0ABV8CTR3_9STRE